MKLIKKKLGIVFIIISLIMLLVGGIFFYNSKSNEDDDNIDSNLVGDELKEEISNKIDVLTSDYYCSLGSLSSANCIYFSKKTDFTSLDLANRLYFLVISNLDNAKKVEYGVDEEIEEDDYRLIGEDLVSATHYLSKEYVEKEFAKIYGDEKIVYDAANSLKRLPYVFYNSERKTYYISQFPNSDKMHSVITENLEYKKENDKLYVKTAVVYLNIKNPDLSSYYIYYTINDEAPKDSVETLDIPKYKIDVDNKKCTFYQFVFNKNEDGKYIFESVEQIDK